MFTLPQTYVDIPELHDAQKEILSGAKRFNCAVCGRRFGKNVLQHELAVTVALEEHQPVGWGSPTYKNLSDDWLTLVDMLAPVTVSKLEQEHRIEVIGGGTLEMWSLDAPDVIRGRKYKRFIINEAASVPRLNTTFNQIIRPTLIDLRGDAWLFGTPDGRNDFWHYYVMGQDDMNAEWKSFHYTSYSNPYLDVSELDALRSTMTEEQYRQEILAEFLEDSGVVFRGVDMACIAPLTNPTEHPKHTIVYGIDWGKHDDFTVISVGCATCKREVDLDRFNQIDYAFQSQRLMGLLAKWKAVHGLGELNAMGEPIVEQLQRSGVRITGFQTTHVSKAPLIEGLALAIEQGSVQLLKDEVAANELKAYTRTVTETGMSKYSAPEGMHDDTVIARALMWRAMTQAPRQREDKPNPWVGVKGI